MGLASPIFDHGVSDQVQPRLRAGGRHVEQPAVLVLGLPVVEQVEVAVDGIVAPRPLSYRCKQQVGATMHARALQPEQQARVVATRLISQSGQNHRVELQALGLVNRHHLKRVVRTRVGERIQRSHALGQRIEVEQIAALLEFV